MVPFHYRREDGAAAVEFAFIVPVLIVLVFGIIQFGIAYNRQQGMHAVAREGARLASVGATVTDIETRVGQALDGTTVDADDAGIEVRRYQETEDPSDTSLGTLLDQGTDTPCDGGDTAHAVRVDLEVVSNVSDYSIIIPLLPKFGQTYPSSAIFRCEDGP